MERNTMSETVAVRFNHGLVSEDGQPDAATTNRVLRMGIGHADDENDAEDMAAVWRKVSEAMQYTEGHHAVTLDLTVDELCTIRLAHRVACDAQTEVLADGWEAHEKRFDDAQSSLTA